RHDAEEIGQVAIERIELRLVGVAPAELEPPMARDLVVDVREPGLVLRACRIRGREQDTAAADIARLIDDAGVVIGAVEIVAADRPVEGIRERSAAQLNFLTELVVSR